MHSLRALVFGALVCAACTNSTTATDGAVVPDTTVVPRCKPGRSVSCTCPDGANGAQVCGADGVYGTCQCRALMDAAVDGTADVASERGSEVQSPTDIVSPVDVADASEERAEPSESGVMDVTDVAPGVDRAVEASTDIATDTIIPDVPSPPSATLRPIAPISAGRVSNRRPTLRWAMPTTIARTRVQLCADRPCTRILMALETTGTSARPETPLPPGIVFWRLQGLNGSGTVVATSATWEFWVGRRDAPIDTSYGTVHDLDGDGYEDVVARDDGEDWLEVFWGGASGPSTTPVRVPSLRPDQTGLILSVIDQNGDGHAEVIASGNAATATTPGHIYRMTSTVGRSVAYTATAEVPDTLHPKICNAGDIDGDGFPDLVAIATNLILFPGSPSGAMVGTNISLAMTSPMVLNACAGADLDADGYSDLVIGGREANFIIPGSVSGLRTDSVTTLPIAEVDQGTRGLATGLGDINGDSYGDVCVGRPGIVFCATGRANIASVTMSIRLVDPYIASGFGIGYGDSLSVSGDLNGDGRTDLLTGASNSGPIEMPGRARFDRAAVFLGGADGFAMSRRIDLSGTVENPLFYFGWSVASVGDLDGDGFDDMAVGAARAGCSLCAFSTDVGAVAVYRGSAMGPSIDWTWLRYGDGSRSRSGLIYGLGANVAFRGPGNFRYGGG